jgi:hypothetical protein
VITDHHGGMRQPASKASYIARLQQRDAGSREEGFAMGSDEGLAEQVSPATFNVIVGRPQSNQLVSQEVLAHVAPKSLIAMQTTADTLCPDKAMSSVPHRQTSTCDV